MAKYWPSASQFVAAASLAVFIKANSRSTAVVPCWPARFLTVSPIWFAIASICSLSPDRRFHSVGFQTVIERVGMILNQVRPLLIGIVGATGSYEAAGHEQH